MDRTNVSYDEAISHPPARHSGLAATEGPRSVLEGLTPAQREAVTTTEGYVRVIAGAGTGKTRALTHRFAYLVNELGIMPGNVLCVTFTNKAANEMRQRIRTLTSDNDTGFVNTFHGFCVSVLQEDGNVLGYPKSFLVLDNSDIDAMLQTVYDERGLTLRHMTFSNARDMIEMIKLKERPDYFQDLLAIPIEELHAKYLQAQTPKDIIFYGYLYQQKRCFGLDYNDLLVLTLHLLERFPAIGGKWRQRLEYIMVDEFQDIDDIQYQLMESLAAHHKNLFVVGDPDQTIYSWRGADSRFLIDFDQTHPGTKTIMMLQNHRSAPAIVDVVNSLIFKNHQRMPKMLEATRSLDGPTVWYHAKTSTDEADWIAQGIQGLQRQGVRLRDVAVLYRAHYASRPVEDALMAAEIPYALSSGTPFFGRKEVKDALSYLRLAAYQDDLSFARVANAPKRNLGKRRMAFLQEQAQRRGCTLYQALELTIDDEVFKRTKARQLLDLVERFKAKSHELAVSELLSALLSESGYERALRTEGSQERLDNLAELKQSIYELETTCGEDVTLDYYLSHVALLTNADATSETREAVRLMTIHAAKGLEFSHVFIPSLNEGVLPSRKTDTIQAMEEERRLAFVAMTRAKDGLYLSEAEGFDHEGQSRHPSRFLLDIHPSTLQFCNKPNDDHLERTRVAIARSEQWLKAQSADARHPVGQRVVHPTFGEGTVQGIDQERHVYLVKFDKLDTARSMTFSAPLEAL